MLILVVFVNKDSLYAYGIVPRSFFFREAAEQLLTPGVLDEFGNHVSNQPCLRDLRKDEGDQQRRHDGKGGPKPVPKSRGQTSTKIHV